MQIQPVINRCKNLHTFNLHFLGGERFKRLLSNIIREIIIFLEVDVIFVKVFPMADLIFGFSNHI